MTIRPGTLLLLALLGPVATTAQQEESYDYWQFNREVISRGMQAVFLCNGLFTSNRTLEQVFAQEIAYIREPVGTSAGGDYEVDRDRRAVAIGAPGAVPTMRAAFREGLGCVVMAPDQDFNDIESLPVLDMPPPPGTRPQSPGRTATSSRTPPLTRRSTPRFCRRLPTGPSTASHPNRSPSASSSSTTAGSFTSATPRVSISARVPAPGPPPRASP